jgi:hypothetical protein
VSAFFGPWTRILLRSPAKSVRQAPRSYQGLAGRAIGRPSKEISLGISLSALREGPKGKVNPGAELPFLPGFTSI